MIMMRYVVICFILLPTLGIVFYHASTYFSDSGAINQTALQVSLRHGPVNSLGAASCWLILIFLFAISIGVAC